MPVSAEDLLDLVEQARLLHVLLRGSPGHVVLDRVRQDSEEDVVRQTRDEDDHGPEVDELPLDHVQEPLLLAPQEAQQPSSGTTGREDDENREPDPERVDNVLPRLVLVKTDNDEHGDGEGEAHGKRVVAEHVRRDGDLLGETAFVASQELDEQRRERGPWSTTGSEAAE